MSEHEEVGFLEKKLPDGTIEKSSKRLIGAIAFGAGGLLTIALGVYSFFAVAADPSTIITVGNSLVFTGAGLLGLGLVEGLRK
jgi:hypothetical protein